MTARISEREKEFVPAHYIPKVLPTFSSISTDALAEYLFYKQIVDKQSNVIPTSIPLKLPSLNPIQLQRLDEVCNETIKIVSSENVVLFEISLKELIFKVIEILKENPSLGILLDVLIVGGYVSQILNVSENCESLLKNLSLAELPQQLSQFPLAIFNRNPPDIDVRFILKGTTKKKRIELASKIEDYFVVMVRKSNPKEYIHLLDGELKTLIINTLFTKFSNPDEDLPNGNRWLLMGLGNRTHFGFDLLFVDHMRRSELFSPEAIKLSYLHKQIYLSDDSKECLNWVWQGMIDRVIGKIRFRNIETIDKAAWLKLISYYCQGINLSDPEGELVLSKRASDLSIEDILKYIEEHYSLNSCERLAYIFQISSALGRIKSSLPIPIVVLKYFEIYPNDFTTVDAGGLENFYVKIQHIENLSEELLKSNNPPEFKLGYELRIFLGLNSKSNLKSILYHLERYYSLISDPIFHEKLFLALRPFTGTRTEEVKNALISNKPFSRDLWVNCLLGNPGWEKEGYEVWHEIYSRCTSQQDKIKIAQNLVEYSFENALKIILEIKSLSSHLAVLISKKLLIPSISFDSTLKILILQCSHWLFDSLLHRKQTDECLKLIKQVPHLCRPSLGVLKTLYESCAPEDKKDLKGLAKANLNDAELLEGWELALPEQFTQWIIQCLKKSDLLNASQWISRVIKEGMINENIELMYPTFRAWIEAILHSSPSKQLLWDLGNISAILQTHPEIYLAEQIYSIYLRLLKSSLAGLSVTGFVGFVGRVNENIERVIECCLNNTKVSAANLVMTAEAVHTVLTKVNYSAYPLSKSTVIKLTKASPLLMEALSSAGEHDKVLALTEAYLERKKEKVIVQACPETMGAWLRAYKERLLKGLLTRDQSAYFGKILSKFLDLKNLYSHDKQEEFISLWENLLTTLISKVEKDLAIKVFLLLSTHVPEKKETFTIAILSLAKTFIQENQFNEAYELLMLPQINSSDLKIQLKIDLIKGIITQKMKGFSLHILLDLVKEVSSDAPELWESIFIEARSQLDRVLMDTCWQKFREVAEECMRSANPVLKAACWFQGILGLIEAKSATGVEFLDLLDKIQEVFQEEELSTQRVEVYLKVLNEIAFGDNKARFNSDNTAKLMEMTVGIVGLLITPEQAYMHEDLRHQLIVIKSGLRLEIDYILACQSLRNEMKSFHSRQSKSKHAKVYHSILGNLKYFTKIDSNAAIREAHELIQIFNNTPDSCHDPFKVIEVTARHPYVNFNVMALFDIYEILTKKPTLAFAVPEKLSAATIKLLVRKIIEHPRYEQLIAKFKVALIINDFLKHETIKKILKKEGLFECWTIYFLNQFKTAETLLNVEDQYGKILGLLYEVEESYPEYFVNTEFLDRFKRLLVEWVRTENFSYVATLTHCYRKALVGKSTAHEYWNEIQNLESGIPHQTFCRVPNKAFVQTLATYLPFSKSSRLFDDLFSFDMGMVRKLIDLKLKEDLNLPQKAFICDFTLSHLRSYMGIINKIESKYTIQLQELIHLYFYLVTPENHVLWVGHIRYDKDIESSLVILMIGLEVKYYQKNPEQFYEYIFLTCAKASSTRNDGLDHTVDLKDNKKAAILRKVLGWFLNPKSHPNSEAYGIYCYLNALCFGGFQNISSLLDLLPSYSHLFVKNAYFKIARYFIIDALFDANIIEQLCKTPALHSSNQTFAIKIFNEIFDIFYKSSKIYFEHPKDEDPPLIKCIKWLKVWGKYNLGKYDAQYIEKLKLLIPAVNKRLISHPQKRDDLFALFLESLFAYELIIEENFILKRKEFIKDYVQSIKELMINETSEQAFLNLLTGFD